MLLMCWEKMFLERSWCHLLLHINILVLSRILAMNFPSFTTRGHSPITWTFTQLQITHRTAFPIIHCTNTAVHNYHACTCFPSHNHHHPITHTHTHYLNPGLSATHCRVLLALLHTKRFPSILSLISCVLILPVLLDYSLCLALWIKFADRRPTLA